VRIILGAGFSGGVLAFALGCSSGGAATTGGASSGAPSAQAKTSTSSASAAPASAAARDTLKVGDPAPDVVFSFTDGTTASLASLKGQAVLVYFYPQDDTPGCTKEAEGIRDAWADFQAAKIKVVGVSMQDATSHQAFVDKYKLPFSLATDVDGALATAFKVPFQAQHAARQSFLVDKDGKISAVWLRVDPSAHASEVLAKAKGA